MVAWLFHMVGIFFILVGIPETSTTTQKTCELTQVFLFLNMIRYTKATYFLLLFITAIIYSCNSDKKSSDKHPQSVNDSTQIRLPHSRTATGMEYINPEDLGTLTARIDFQISATPEERKIFEDGIVPWISLDDPAGEINRLIDPDKLVLPYNKVILIIDYPVMAPVYIPLNSTGNGFSRRQLITSISQQYHSMYKEEEETATDKTVPADERKDLLNRNETNGRYGIWGHDLSDLDLSSIEVYRNKNGIIYLSLGVES
jgi:hypothetical protein